MANNYVYIPLTNEPNQTFKVTVPVDGKNLPLILTLRYNTQGNFWWMTIRDKDGNVVLDSIPLLPGKWPLANILGPYKYLGLGSAFIVKMVASSLEQPDNTTLGSQFKLMWGSSI